MRFKSSNYIVGIALGIVACVALAGFGAALYKNRFRLKGIAKAQYKNYFRQKSGQIVVSDEERKLPQPQGPVTVRLDMNKKGRRVDPFLYGVNLSPKMESEADIIQFVRKTGIRMVRFPGGGSPGYHWKDGTFDFTDRFDSVPFRDINYVVEFCKITGTELVFQVNIESGTPQEAADLVRYLNLELGFRVEYWELGNEVYGDWDLAFMDGKKYAQVINDYARAMKEVDPSVKIGMDWAPSTRWFFNTEAIQGAGDNIDFVSIHWYPNLIDPAHSHNGRIHPLPEEVMANYLHIPGIVDLVHKTFAQHNPTRKKEVEVTFLEWDGAQDGPASDFPPYSHGIVQWSLANAIFFADCLGMFASTGVVASAPFDFQSIGFGFIRGWDKEAGWGGQRWDGEIVRPKALALELFSNYFGDVMVESQVSNSPFYFKGEDWWPETYGGRVPYLSAYASTFEDKGGLALVLINKHARDDISVQVNIEGARLAPQGKMFVLTGPELLSQNEGDPLNVGIKSHEVKGVGDVFDVKVPAHSVVLIQARAREASK